MSHLVETMAYAGAVPWHGLGNALTGRQPVGLWQREAGMDWSIACSDVLFNVADDGMHIRRHADARVLYRSDTLAPLSVVSPRYKVVQPAEVLAFYRDLVSAGGFGLETAGVLKGGRKLWRWPGPGVLEIEAAEHHAAPQWEDGIPVAYQCQVLRQLAVTGHARADVAVLAGGQDFRIWRVERDEAKIADLIRREAAFWQAVETDWQPAPDGSDDAGRALLGLFPQDNGDALDLSESGECNALFGDLLVIRRRKEEAEAVEAKLRQQLLAAMGHAASAVFEGGRISWKKGRDRRVLDTDRLEQAHPELWQTYGKPVAGCRCFVIQTEEEYRMIKGLAITPPVIGRISIGKLVQQGDRWLPEKDDAFTLTTQVQTRNGWLLHPLHRHYSEACGSGKLRTLPVPGRDAARVIEPWGSKDFSCRP